MTELMYIGEYVYKTAKIIASVMNEEVVICDEEGRLIGDSKKEEPWDVWDSPINNESILWEAMGQRSVALRENIKETQKSCARCKNIQSCDINSIIAFPIMKEEKVLGCIGVYSKNKTLARYSAERTRFLIDFTSEMSEMILSKLAEKKENQELTMVKRQLQEVIENLDKAVVCIDNDKRILHANASFRTLFQLGRQEPERLSDVKPIGECRELWSQIDSERRNREYNREFQFTIGTKTKNIFVSIRAIHVGEDHAGFILYFKDASDYYEEINRISNSSAPLSFDDIIGVSNGITQLKKRTMLVAKSPSTILIQGESGTGKEIFSRAIHHASSRSQGPFITVNCAAIPDNLLESELFGYEEGAFTGAAKGGRIGKFQLANKGTLFLDEVGEIPIQIDIRIVRAIQEKKIQKLGSNKDIDIDIRIIAATNRDLESMMRSGEFREDLYYRLKVIPIMIPPLRERKNDIPVLLDHYIRQYNRVLGKEIRGFSKKALQRIHSYNWPGNIRELQNMVEYCVNMASGDVVEERELPINVRQGIEPLSSDRIRPLEEIEKYYIEEAVRIYGNSVEGKEKAADALGIGIATLYRKLKE